MSAFLPADFQRRAAFEADRYGSDPWVFLRELLQNARDAGAGHAQVRAEVLEGTARVSCRDDGTGMTLAHARRFLFALYASSKEKEAESAGRFGVGFWSVLRFAPARILVRSWPRGGEAWEIALSGDLSDAAQGFPPPHQGSGTEVILERPAREPDLGRVVFEAAWRDARYLRRRNDPGRRLEVTVNGRAVNATFDLPPPSARFRRGRSRGVVALGSTAGVELFAMGLRVRAAAALGDLLAPTAPPPAFPALAEGVAPRALLEGEDLDLLLARGDARDDRALRRLVRLAQGELERLVMRQLDAIRPRSWWQRGRDTLRARATAAALLLAGGAAAFAAAGVLRFREAPAPWAEPVATGDVSPVPYRDLAGRYHGPQMDALPRGRRPIALAYSPPAERPRFAALIVDRLDSDGRLPPPEPSPSRPYPESPCARECLEVEILADGGPGPLRLPVPTGHSLDPASVLLDGRRDPIMTTANGEPVVALPGPQPMRVRYRTGPAALLPAPLAPPPPLPADLSNLTRELHGRPVAERVSRLLEAVRSAVAYSTDDALIPRHRAAAAAGQPFVQRTLAIGAGDCDIQNGLLTLLLQAAGVPARLALGYLGESGRVAPWLHAWVEYRDDSGPWRIADASVGAATGSPALITPAARLAATYPPPRPGSRATRPAIVPPGSLVRPGALALGLILLGAAATGLVRARRTRRSLHLDREQDLARLLLGALQQPDGFGPGSAVFHRRLIPLFPRGALSLAEAWDLASQGRLYSTRTRSALARNVARRLAVADAARPEGVRVVDTLGAVDLDAWDALLARSRTGELLDALNAYLRHQGEGWAFRMAPEAGAACAVLRLVPLRGGRRTTARVVVLDESAPWLREAQELWRSRPAEALFSLADRLLDVIGPPARSRSHLLAPLARAAVLEATP